MESKDNNKKLVDEVFENLEDTVKSHPRPQPPEERSTLQGQTLSVRTLLNSLSADYDRVLGTELNLKDRGQYRFTDLITTPDGLPFMAHALNSSVHYSKHLTQFGKMSGTQLGDLKDTVIVPVFMTCAGMALRIHKLPYAPEVDITSFDTSRIDTDPNHVKQIVDHIKALDGDNRQRWIGVLCYDACMLLVNTLTSILGERAPNQIAEALFSMMLMPVLSGMMVAFMKNMVITSQELDRL